MLRRRLALVALAAGGRVGSALPEARPLRVCLFEAAIPPYFNLDDKRPGWSERLMRETGRSLGMRIQFLTGSARRCVKMLEQGEADAMIAAPIAENLAQMRFPMKAGGVDRDQRLASVSLVWVKRQDTPLDWDGKAMTGQPPGGARLKVGVRAGLRVAAHAAADLGYDVQETSADVRAALRMLNAGRFDVLLGIRELVDASLRDPALNRLVVMPRPLMRLDFYVTASPRLDAAAMAQFERWWQLMGELRDHPSFNRD